MILIKKGFSLIISIVITFILLSSCRNSNNTSFYGISYARFRSTSVNPDKAGFLVEYVKAEITQ